MVQEVAVGATVAGQAAMVGAATEMQVAQVAGGMGHRLGALVGAVEAGAAPALMPPASAVGNQGERCAVDVFERCACFVHSARHCLLLPILHQSFTHGISRHHPCCIHVLPTLPLQALESGLPLQWQEPAMSWGALIKWVKAEGFQVAMPWNGRSIHAIVCLTILTIRTQPYMCYCAAPHVYSPALNVKPYKSSTGKAGQLQAAQGGSN